MKWVFTEKRSHQLAFHGPCEARESTEEYRPLTLTEVVCLPIDEDSVMARRGRARHEE